MACEDFLDFNGKEGLVLSFKFQTCCTYTVRLSPAESFLRFPAILIGIVEDERPVYCSVVRSGKLEEMAVTRLLILFFFFFSTPLSAQPGFRYHVCSDSNGNYTANDSYGANLHNLLSSILTLDYVYYGFFNFSLGQNSNAANAIGVCRGDIDSAACRSCLNNSRILLPRLCPNRKEAIGWYNECMLKYSNRSIFGLMETDPYHIIWTTANVSDWDQYYRDLRILLDDLKGKAAGGTSLLKYEAGSAPTSNFRTLYALLQCTPDLSKQECDDCLTTSISRIPSCCSGSVIVGSPSCYLRYEENRFYQPSLPQSPPPLLSPPPVRVGEEVLAGKENDTSRIVIVIVVPIVGVLVVMSLICIFICFRRKRSNERAGDVKTEESLQFDFETIRNATNNFSEENKLGEGGFGAVYKGKLSDGQVIAVKRLSGNSAQGDVEFRNEVQLVAKLQHRNLVRLHGFCLDRNERVLVYEFVTNTSLDRFIFDPVKRLNLRWQNRYEIISGIARGLLYLHEDSQLRIIHRDLKASNVLLDAMLKPKIADFGLAKLFESDQTQGNTSKIAGTFGYMAPEYVHLGQFSVKSDVYSFGVIVLEIVSGRSQNNLIFEKGESTEHLLGYAWRNWKEGKISNIIDSTLERGWVDQIMRCIQIGLLCVQERATSRPTMASVVLMLSSSSLTLSIPSRPAFLLQSNIEPSASSEVSLVTPSGKRVDIEPSANEASITDLYPR